MINSPVLCALQTEQRQILVPPRRQRQARNFGLVRSQLARRQLECNDRAFLLGLGCSASEEKNTSLFEENNTSLCSATQGRRGKGRSRAPACAKRQKEHMLRSQQSWGEPLDSSEPISSPVAQREHLSCRVDQEFSKIISAKFITQRSVYSGYLTNSGTDRSWGPVITDSQFNQQTWVR